MCDQTLPAFCGVFFTYRVRKIGQVMILPPFTWIVCPVMCLAASLARKSDGFGDIFRPAGVAERNSLRGGFPFDVGVVRSDARRGDPPRRDGVDAHAAGRRIRAPAIGSDREYRL